jgi:hypothetical protein
MKQPMSKFSPHRERGQNPMGFNSYMLFVLVVVVVVRVARLRVMEYFDLAVVEAVVVQLYQNI